MSLRDCSPADALKVLQKIDEAAHAERNDQAHGPMTDARGLIKIREPDDHVQMHQPGKSEQTETLFEPQPEPSANEAQHVWHNENSGDAEVGMQLAQISAGVGINRRVVKFLKKRHVIREIEAREDAKNRRERVGAGKG